jgi:hypothetical protein
MNNKVITVATHQLIEIDKIIKMIIKLRKKMMMKRKMILDLIVSLLKV